MFKFVSSVCAAVMVVTVPFAAPAVAMPMAKPAPAWSDAAPILVQRNDIYDMGRGYRRGWTPRPEHWRDDGPRVRHWRGHRGYRDYRPGYRRHNGYWFPPAAFIAGAIIGGAIAGQEPPIRYRPRGGAHEEWCYNRYRSYRASDNTFQPYNGPRKQCMSAYLR